MNESQQCCLSEYVVYAACMPLVLHHHAWGCCLLNSVCRRGLLIRGGDILEAASKVDSVVFDKTGTLTAGRPAVTLIHAAPASGMNSGQLLALAAALERESTHPIAAAINEAASSQGVAHLTGHKGCPCESARRPVVWIHNVRL